MQQSSTRGSVRAPIVLLVLALFAVTGLGAGIMTRTALAGIGVHLTPSVQNTAPAGTPTSRAATSPPSPTVSVPAQLAPSGFTLSANVSPNVAARGQSLAVTVVAIGASGAPLPGVACYLEAADASAAGLLPVAPAPAVTGSDGSAAWTITVPQVAAGRYSLQVRADGQHGWKYHVFVTVTVRS